MTPTLPSNHSLQRHFRAVFDEVVRKNIPFVLTRCSRPEAALISYEEFLRYQSLKESDLLARFDELVARMAEQNAEISEEEGRSGAAAAWRNSLAKLSGSWRDSESTSRGTSNDI